MQQRYSIVGGGGGDWSLRKTEELSRTPFPPVFLYVCFGGGVFVAFSHGRLFAHFRVRKKGMDGGEKRLVLWFPCCLFEVGLVAMDKRAVCCVTQASYFGC